MCQPVCPFEAISIEPRMDGRPYDTQVSITPDRCERCGFCVAACEFSGITMGEMDKLAFQENVTELLREAGKEGEGGPPVLAFICERSMNLENVLSTDRSAIVGVKEAAVMTIPCIGVISSSLLDTAFRAGAGGVVIVGCRALDCHYREGNERIEAFMSPRALESGSRVPVSRVKVMLVSRFEDAQTIEEIKKFISGLDRKNNRIKGIVI